MLKHVFGILVYIVSVILVILLWENNILLTLFLIVLIVAFLIVWHSKNDFYTLLFGAFFGWFTESVLVYFGAWKYTNPTFLVPLWLPVVWGIAALLIRRFNLYMEKVKK